MIEDLSLLLIVLVSFLVLIIIILIITRSNKKTKIQQPSHRIPTNQYINLDDIVSDIVVDINLNDDIILTNWKYDHDFEVFLNGTNITTSYHNSMIILDSLVSSNIFHFFFRQKGQFLIKLTHKNTKVIKQLVFNVRE